MRKSNPVITDTNTATLSPQATIHNLAVKYMAVSSNVNKATSQQPYLEYFKMHKDFMRVINLTIEKIDSQHAKSACIDLKLSISKIHDSIQKEYHRRNNFIIDLGRRFL